MTTPADTESEIIITLARNWYASSPTTRGDLYREFCERVMALESSLSEATKERDEQTEQAQANFRLAERIQSQLSTANSRLAELEADARRWNWVKAGLFSTPHPEEVHVVYQSGSLDEIAQELHASLPQDVRGIVWDVTPIIDAALAASTDEAR